MAEMKNKPTKSTKNDGRNCKICGLIFPDIYSYTDHLESKHIIKDIMKKKYGEKYLEAKTKLMESNSSMSSNNKNNLPTNNEQPKQDNSHGKSLNNIENPSNISQGENADSTDNEISDSDSDAEVYTCEDCKKICTGILSYKLHLSGRKHLKTIKRNKIIKQMQKDHILAKDNDKDDDQLLEFNNEEEYATKGILCKLCNKTCSGPHSFKQHKESGGHKKKLAAQRAMEDISHQNTELEKEREDKEDMCNAPIMNCESCSKSFTGPIPYKQHLESTVHFKQIRQLKQIAKLKDASSSSDNEKFFCNDCEKYFSGPLPYQTHISSSTHEKRKEKNDLIKMLQEQYKEMTLIDNSKSDSEDSDNDQIISCSMCHISFSGPESARDHFQSPKHKKVVKEKKRLQRIKMKTKVKNANLNESALTDEKHCESDESFDIIG